MNKIFSNVLKDFMEKRHLNQTEFAALIGAKQPQVSEWLSGKAYPGYESIKAMCETFELTADFFLGFTDEEIPIFYKITD